MEEKKRRLPSPTTVIAVIALVVALSGSAYAAVKLKKNSVGPKQLKDNAVVERKISGGAVTESKLAGGVVGRDKLKSDEQTQWALVNGSTNGIVAQSGGISVAAGSGGGEYFIKFPVQLPGRAVIASLQASQSSGEVLGGICGAAFPTSGVEQIFCNTTSPSDNNPSVARVDTGTSNSGLPAARNFYIAVLGR
jgi:hypothetical protein